MPEGGGSRSQATSCRQRSPILETQTQLSRQEARNTRVHLGEDKGQQRPISGRRGEMRARSATLGLSQSLQDNPAKRRA